MVTREEINRKSWRARKQQLENRRQNSENRIQNPELRTRNFEPGTSNPELQALNSEPRTRLPVVMNHVDQLLEGVRSLGASGRSMTQRHAKVWI
jgi:hypothetical protein